MNFKILLCALALWSFDVAASSVEDDVNISRITHIKAQNSLDSPRYGAVTLIPLSLLPGTSPQDVYLTEIDSVVVANQKVDADNDGAHDALMLLADYAAKEAINIKVTLPLYGRLDLKYPALTQAEMAMRLGGELNDQGVYEGGNYFPVSSMSLPPQHTIGDKLFKYEGFGWESDRIAYRFYFDERGLIDIFGKQIPELILGRVGLDSGDYHELSDWGMDVLKVGPSLGMGGAAGWVDGKVEHPNQLENLTVKLESGPINSSATVTQSGWKLGDKTLDFTRRFSIVGHSHLTHTRVISSAPMKNLAVGLVKHGVEKFENLSAGSEWNYIATFGAQSLADDDLGMVIFFRHSDLEKVTEDEFNELVILNMGTSLNYYFGARWQGESSSMGNREEFIQYLEGTRKELNSPVSVSLRNGIGS